MDPFGLAGGLASLARTGRRVVHQALGELMWWGWENAVRTGTIGPTSPRGARFGRLGDGAAVMFPAVALYGERWMRIGDGTVIGPLSSLSVGMHPDQIPVQDPVLVVGKRCVIGRGSSIVAHLSVEIGDDVWTGPHVYITDQNHGYEDLTRPIGWQAEPEQPVRIGSGTWLGTGVVVLPGARIGEHVVVGAGSVVTGELPDHCVAVGAPARVVRIFVPGRGWVRN